MSELKIYSYPEPIPEVLNAKEAAKFLRIGINQFYEAVGRGDIPHQKIGRSFRFSKTALLQWLGCGAQEE